MSYREVSMLEIKEVLRRKEAGSSARRIARDMGLDRKTVRRYLSAIAAAGVGDATEVDDGVLSGIGQAVQQRPAVVPSRLILSEAHMVTSRPKGNSVSKGMPIVHRHAAGMDIGSTFHVVAVPADADAEPVRKFSSFTGDLHRLADWLKHVGITTVAMESTGIYWVPVYEILEERGLEVVLVNARDAKNVPGRKTDVNDAQWLQRLHECGLLRASFRPQETIVALRSYLRHRERMIEFTASHIQHMQKALMQMNLQLHHVVSDITGLTGMQIIRAIVQGTRDPATLSKLRDVRCKASEATLCQALTGNYRAEHLFSLRQAVELYDTYQEKIHDCDKEIDRCLSQLNANREVPAAELPKRRQRRPGRNEPAIDLQSSLFTLVGGIDLTQIHGLGPYSALRSVAE